MASASVNYDEDTKVLRISLGPTCVDFKGVSMEMFAELCAAFGYFRDRFNAKQEMIVYRSVDKYSFAGSVLRR